MIKAFKSIFITNDNESPVLNGFRALAIIMIMMFHFNGAIYFMKVSSNLSNLFFNVISNFNCAVDLFFVLSGFLVSGGLYNRWLNKKDNFFRNFWARRILKIFPAYYIFLILAFIFLAVTITLLQSSPQTPGTVANLKYALGFRDKYIYDVFLITNIIEGAQPHTWALSTEIQYYIIFPVIGYFFLFKLSPAKRILALSCFYIIQLAARIVALSVDLTVISGYNFIYLLNHMRFDSIIIGIIIMDLYYNCNGLVQKITGCRLVILIVAGCALLTVAHVHEYIFTESMGNSIKYNFSNLGYGLIVLAGLAGNNVLSKVLSLRFWTPIARVSYIIYLWHFLTPSISINLFFNIKKMYINYTNYAMLFLVYAACTFFFSTVLYCLTEYPFARLKSRIKFQERID